MKIKTVLTDVIITDGGAGAILAGRCKNKKIYFKVRITDQWEHLGIPRAL